MQDDEGVHLNTSRTRGACRRRWRRHRSRVYSGIVRFRDVNASLASPATMCVACGISTCVACGTGLQEFPDRVARTRCRCVRPTPAAPARRCCALRPADAAGSARPRARSFPAGPDPSASAGARRHRAAAVARVRIGPCGGAAAAGTRRTSSAASSSARIHRGCALHEAEHAFHALVFPARRDVHQHQRPKRHRAGFRRRRPGRASRPSTRRSAPAARPASSRPPAGHPRIVRADSRRPRGGRCRRDRAHRKSRVRQPCPARTSRAACPGMAALAEAVRKYQCRRGDAPTRLVRQRQAIPRQQPAGNPDRLKCLIFHTQEYGFVPDACQYATVRSCPPTPPASPARTRNRRPQTVPTRGFRPTTGNAALWK